MMMPALPPAVPLGAQCTDCVRRHRDCSDLNFDAMPVDHTRDGVRMVRCTVYVPDRRNGRPRQ